MSHSNEPSRFLRRALLGNAVFSGVSGLTMVVAAAPLAKLIGAVEPGMLVGTGVILMVFAASLMHNVRSKSVRIPEAWIAVMMDLGWVAGSIAVISMGVLAPAGSWIVGIVADLVLIFALLQMYGLRKLRRVTSAREAA